MSAILYRHRNLTALLGAVAIGAGSLLIFPAVAAKVAKVATQAATPECDGTQNPFVSR